MQHYLDNLDSNFEYAFNVSSSVHPLGIGYAGFLNVYRLDEDRPRMIFRKIMWESSNRKSSSIMAVNINEIYLSNRHGVRKFESSDVVLFRVQRDEVARIFAQLTVKLTGKMGYDEDVALYFLDAMELEPVTIILNNCGERASYIVRDSNEAARVWLTILENVMHNEEDPSLKYIRSMIDNPKKLEMEYTKADIDEMDEKFSELKKELYKNLHRREEEIRLADRRIKQYNKAMHALEVMDPVLAKEVLDSLDEFLEFQIRVDSSNKTNEKYDSYIYEGEQMISRAK